MSRSQVQTSQFTVDYITDGRLKTGTHIPAPPRDMGVQIKHTHANSSALVVTYFLKRRGLLQFVVISLK